MDSAGGRMTHTRQLVLAALNLLGPSTAQDVADLCDLDPEQAAVALLRCMRSQLVIRRRARRQERWVPGPRFLFVYALTRRGLSRLKYWRSCGDYY